MPHQPGLEGDPLRQHIGAGRLRCAGRSRAVGPSPRSTADTRPHRLHPGPDRPRGSSPPRRRCRRRRRPPGAGRPGRASVRGTRGVPSGGPPVRRGDRPARGRPCGPGRPAPCRSGPRRGSRCGLHRCSPPRTGKRRGGSGCPGGRAGSARPAGQGYGPGLDYSLDSPSDKGRIPAHAASESRCTGLFSCPLPGDGAWWLTAAPGVGPERPADSGMITFLVIESI